MSKLTYLQDLEQIAKAYCKKMGYTFIFANEYKFGFETKDGGLFTISYMDLYEKLKEEETE